MNTKEFLLILLKFVGGILVLLSMFLITTPILFSLVGWAGILLGRLTSTQAAAGAVWGTVALAVAAPAAWFLETKGKVKSNTASLIGAIFTIAVWLLSMALTK